MNAGRISGIYIITGLILIAAGVPLKNTCLGFYIASASIVLIGIGVLFYIAGIAGRPSTARMAMSYITLGLTATLSLIVIPASYRDIAMMLSFALVEVGVLFAVAYVLARLYSTVKRSPGTS